MSNLIDQLRWYKEHENRGFLAQLRCYLITAKRSRAWPALHRLNVDITDENRSYIAAWYAVYPEEAEQGNLGTTCRLIKNNRKENTKDNDKLTPTERRFLQLLASSSDELFDRITRMVLMAKSQHVPINYEQLEKDVMHWNENTKIIWAKEFWIAGETIAQDRGGI